ncbi:MAG TPA: hypothetical protein VE758_07435 [Chthoniobacterales bacterium]|nr:hypothetical protein [Chthoniobacterales bacterium]
MARIYKTQPEKRRDKLESKANISLALRAFWLRVLEMGKSALAPGCAFLLLCLAVSAQQGQCADTLNSLTVGQFEIPALNLGNAQPFSFPSTLAWVDAAPPQFLPPLPQPAAQRTVTAGSDLGRSSKEVVDLPRRNLLDEVHGEIGVLYGHSFGKFSGDMEAGYIFGQVGDDKLQINVGATYDHWSGRAPRFWH